MLAPALALLNLCGTSGGKAGDAENPVHVGDGWAIRLPTVGAKVEATPARISIDARDYSRWFDVRLYGLTDDLSIHPRTLGATLCDPAVFDRPIVTDDAWTAGGLCTRGSRFQWMIARAERHGDRTLVFFYVANPDFLTFEDAWVDFARTAATITARPEAPEGPPGPELRSAIRRAAKEIGRTDSPLPGGGVLSTHVIPQLDAAWAVRAAAGPPPERFAPPAGPDDEARVDP